MNEIELVRNNVFTNKIIIIDGQGRSGKNLISILLSTMDKVEKMRLDSQFDYLPRYLQLGKMTKDATITALRTEADEKLFYTMIGRDVNFRLKDYSGVMKQGQILKYFKRILFTTDEQAVQEINDSGTIFQEMTHDGLHLVDTFFEAFGERLLFIHLFRDPVENIFEQNNRDFGTRIGNDPREFQLAYKWHGEIIPLNAIGLEKEYLNGNPTERLVLMVDALFRKNIYGYHNLNDIYKKQILFLDFEEFVINPYEQMSLIEKFTCAKFGKSKKRIMKRENCPRIIQSKERQNKILTIKDKISDKYKIIFDNLIKDYDKKEWNEWNNNYIN
jgi:hypothetical protein